MDSSPRAPENIHSDLESLSNADPPQRSFRGSNGWKLKTPRTTRPISEYPPGYSRLAAYEDSDPNLLMYRKFGWLHNRVLLHHQDELVQLEEELEQLDQYDEQNEPERLYSRRRDDERHPRRKELLQTIEEKLGKFDELLLRMKDLHAISRPTKRNQTTLWNLIQYSGNQAQAESEWIKCSDDLGALASNQENNRFNGYVEDALTFISRRLTTWLFRTKSQNYRTGNEEHLMLWSRHRYHAFVYSILTVLATVLLLVPIALLYEVKTVGIVQILIIFGFTLFFSASCAFTNARVKETFAATAVYAAVLVLFMGNSTPQRVYAYPNGIQMNATVSTAN